MSSLKQIKFEAKSAAAQQQVIRELNEIARDIERSEKTIAGLNRELQAANTKFQGPRNTREDVAYLTCLLECAKRKLAWEKQISSLQKRTPSLMERMAAIMNDPRTPPSNELREQMLTALQAIKVAMERLQVSQGVDAGPANEGPIEQSPASE